MKNIAIIGVGALGKRHLQSMIELRIFSDIYAVEVNQAAVIELKKEFPDVLFVESINALPELLDAVVIATSSNIRKEVFDELLEHSKVTNIIFEKVLFQRVQDYYEVDEKLNAVGTKAWVNCARREWASYKKLKKDLAESKEIHFSAIGGEWGLGCNAIHMLDLVEYLSGEKISELITDKLENKIIESKRSGYCEFFGKIYGTAGRCKNYEVICMDASAMPLMISITTDNNRYIIDERNNSIMISDSTGSWKTEEFRQVYQSQMTGRVIKSILEEGTCDLADYKESMELHLKLINPLITFFNNNGREGDSCPIT